MASWTDDVNKLTQYTPHISTNPVDSMVAAGTYLQQQYQQGLDTVNSYVSSLNNLEFAKKGAKEYVDSQLGNLRSGVAKSLAGDLSNQSLVSQIKSSISSIGNDPVIETELMNTANAKNQFEAIKSARKEGKSNVANEWDFQSKYASWLNDGQLGTSFDAQYTPYTDYTSEFLKRLKEIHPSSTLTQDQVRINDGTGQIEVLNEKEREGISPESINNLWNSVRSNPDVQRQLSIEGRFKYKDVQSADDFINTAKSNYNRNLFEIDNKIQELQARSLVDKTLNSELVTRDINTLEQYKKNLSKELNNTIGILSNNDLDSAKAQLYNQDISANFMNTYSWSKEKDKIIDSPLFDAHMKQANYELQQAKFAWDKEKDNRDYELKKKELELKQTKVGTKGSGTLSGMDTITNELPTNQSVGEKGSQSFYNDIKTLEGQLDQGINQTLFNLFNEPGSKAKNPIKITTENGQKVYRLNVDPNDPNAYKSVNEANEIIGNTWAEARAAVKSGKASQQTSDDFNTLVDPIARKLDNARYTAKQIEEPFKQGIEKIKNEFGISDLNENLKLRLVSTGDTLENISTKDIVNYALTQHSKDKSTVEAAKQELIKSLGEYNADKLIQFGVYKSKDYNKAEKIINAVKKNKSLVDIYQNRESKFKDAQNSFNQYETTITASTAEEKERMRQIFLKSSEKFNVNNNTKDFVGYLETDGSEKANAKVRANVYSTIYDRNDNSYYLKVTRGNNDNTTIKVDAQLFTDIGFSTSNPFWDKFGADLSQTKGSTTDVKNTGSVNAYQLQKANDNLNYTVTYHLKGLGNGLYSMYIYAYDKSGNPVISGKATPAKTEEQIMNILQSGIPDKDVEALKTK